MNWTRTWAVAGGVVALAAAARGQAVLVLRPAAFHVAAGRPVEVHLETGGKPVAWDDSRVRWMFVRGEGTQENMDAAPAAPPGVGVRETVSLPAPPAGAAAMGIDFRPVVETIDAEQLRGFAKSKCDGELPVTAKGPLRVARVQSCKTLLRVGEGGGSYAALSEGTQQAEIVTFMDPTRALVGGDIAIVTSVSGHDLEDARVLATSVATGKTQEVRTGDGGAGHIHIDAAGEWRVEFHHLERGKEGSGAEWALVSATLTFEVPVGGAR